jgi:hypothetical protein
LATAKAPKRAARAAVPKRGPRDEAERDPTLGMAVETPTSVARLRVVIESSAELAGIRVRFARGRIAIEGVREEQLVTLAPAIMLAVSGVRRSAK